MHDRGGFDRIRTPRGTLLLVGNAAFSLAFVFAYELLQAAREPDRRLLEDVRTVERVIVAS